MELSIIHLLNQSLYKAAGGLNVQLLWFFNSEKPIICESFSNYSFISFKWYGENLY